MSIRRSLAIAKALGLVTSCFKEKPKAFRVPLSDRLGVTMGFLEGVVQISRAEQDEITNLEVETEVNHEEELSEKVAKPSFKSSKSSDSDDQALAACCLNVKTMHLI